MHLCRHSLTLSASLLLAVACRVGAAEPAPGDRPAPLSAEEVADGWIALFDGHSLFGWTPHCDANFRVAEGTIVVDSGERGLLCTNTPFADYLLRLEFNAEPGTNSGVFLRTPGKPTDPKSDCYELNIAPADNPFPTGSLVGRIKAEGFAAASRWQSFEVRVEGDMIAVRVDGREAIEYRDPQPLRAGLIGLQLNSGKVAFRNIRLKPLGAKPLFNGRDLEGWQTYPQMASEFRVDKPGELHVVNGRGQLETKGSYGDFLLQLESITHAPKLNSGVFFRCIPGETMNGYEAQIHNVFADGDRTKPADFGTGAIYRRVAARRVVADDLEWNAMTVAANGAHVAIWVNGYQVTDWTDSRVPHDNPRNGLRTAPGTLMLQGHDPTTDLSFRNLRIIPLDP